MFQLWCPSLDKRTYPRARRETDVPHYLTKNLWPVTFSSWYKSEVDLITPAYILLLNMKNYPLDCDMMKDTTKMPIHGAFLKCTSIGYGVLDFVATRKCASDLQRLLTSIAGHTVARNPTSTVDVVTPASRSVSRFGDGLRLQE